LPRPRHGYDTEVGCLPNSAHGLEEIGQVAVARVTLVPNRSARGDELAEFILAAADEPQT
jgi:hypothetical protein